MSDWTAGYVADIGYTFGYLYGIESVTGDVGVSECRLSLP